MEQERDCAEIRKRTLKEGLPFLTVTLPRLGKSIDEALATGNPLATSNFSRRKGSQIPKFLGSLLEIIFSTDGVPLAKGDSDGYASRDAPMEGSQPESSNTLDSRSDAMVLALRALRQVCFIFYKLELPYSESQQAEVISTFVSTDAGLADCLRGLSDLDRGILSTARQLICRVLGNADPLSGLPKHGPGAVATGEKPHQKHVFSRYYEALNSVFSYDDWFYLNSDHLCDDYSSLQSMEVLEAGTAKVVLVPKDSRGPRLISCEPLEYQWIQQALMHVLVDVIEKHPLTRGYVNFTHQSINRALALEGSKGDFPFVTLDMKEASDRVSVELVGELFPEHWYRALYASRSPATKLPDGTIVHLNKFAPMGSAVCFPVEALVFWALSVASLVNTRTREAGKPLPSVYVYGDDIICGKEDDLIVSNTLSKFGLMLNEKKCCRYGPFKESCGMDAFLGHPVTPLRVRKVWCSTKKPGLLASWVAFSNAAWEAGLLSSASFVEKRLIEIWGRNSIPTTSRKDTGVIAFVRSHVVDRLEPSNRTRYNKYLHRMELRGFTLTSRSVMTEKDGWPLLARYLIEMNRTRGESAWLLRSGQHETGEYAVACSAKLIKAWTPCGI